MPRSRTLAALALALLAAGCGSSSPHSSRPAVAAYVRDINRVEAQLAAPLKTVTVAGSRLTSSTTKVNTAEVASLERASGQIETLRRRLTAIVAPAAARKLRILVLLLAGGEADMTNELSQLFSFLPRYSKVLGQLGPATTQLRSALAARGSASDARAVLDDKAKALDRYRIELESLARTLGSLSAPPVAKPEYEAELKALAAMNASAGQLAQSLRSASGTVTSKLLAFDRAAVQTESVPAQRAEIAAVKSYDARVARLNTLAQQIASVRLKLEEGLG